MGSVRARVWVAVLTGCLFEWVDLRSRMRGWLGRKLSGLKPVNGADAGWVISVRASRLRGSPLKWVDRDEFLDD